jgi:hypothetical protein
MKKTDFAMRDALAQSKGDGIVRAVFIHWQRDQMHLLACRNSCGPVISQLRQGVIVKTDNSIQTSTVKL